MTANDDLASADELLWDAWSHFCDELKEAGKLVFTHSGPANLLNRAAGFEYLARYLPKALDKKFNVDPLFPQFFWLQSPTSKTFGDNPDCTYFEATIDGEHTYRIVGNRGTVKWVSFMVGPSVAWSASSRRSVITNKQLITNWDGSFEITLSPDEQPGNWLQTEPGNNRIFIRQFFGSWDEEEPMRIRVERVGQDGPPALPTPEGVAQRLRDTIGWLREDSEWWSRFVDYYREWPNEFIVGVPPWLGGWDGDVSTLNRSFWFCHWVVQPDEALVITVKPPECFWWNFELNNEWMNAMEYRYRLSSLNSVQADYNDDGSIVVVLSHVDPGIPNWLDASGYTSGEINQRWVEAKDHPQPQTKLVKVADLENALPKGARRIDRDGRREQLRRRKIGVDRRFPV